MPYKIETPLWDRQQTGFKIVGTIKIIWKNLDGFWMLVFKGSNCDIVHVNWFHMLLFNFHALIKNSSQFLLMQFLLITGGFKKVKKTEGGGSEKFQDWGGWHF